MADNSRKAKLSTEVDSSGAKKGFDEVKQGARDMAQAVAQAGQTAGKGMDAVGDGARRAADGLTREEGRMRSAIQRATLDLQTLGRAASERLEAKINLQGLDPAKFQPYIAALKQVEEAQRSAQQSQQASTRADSFTEGIRSEIAALRERQIALEGGADALLRYKAAQAGAGADTQHLITQLTNMRAAQEAAAQAARDEAAAQKAAAAAASQRTSFLDGLKQQSEAIGKTRADLAEMQAAQLGVAQAAAPYIAKLREAEAGQAGLGNSAKMTAFALRQVPMQFTDIVVSLSSGQRPMQVLLQQGGQLKDIFGGIAPAARALGSYVIGLVNPFTVAAAAAVGLGVAMASAESKARSLASVQAQLAGTGRSELFSDSGLRDFIKELSLAPGVTRDSATAIVSELSKVHEIGGGMFKDLGRLAADYAKATGTDVPTAARTLAQAFADPAKGAKTLDDALGNLTSGQLLAIQQLDRTGNKIGAQQALFQATEQAIKGLNERGTTPLADSFNKLGKAWDGATDKFRNSDDLRNLNALLGTTIKGVAWLIENAPRVPTLGANLVPGLGGVATAVRAGQELVGPSSSEEKRTAAGKVTVFGTASIAAGNKEVDEEIKRATEVAKTHLSEAGQIKGLTQERTRLNNALQKSIELANAEKGAGKSIQDRLLEQEKLRDGIAGINKQISGLGKSQGVRDAQLQEQIQAAQDAFARERDTIAFQGQYLQGQYQAGEISLVDFYEKKRQAIVAGTNAQIAALETERKAVEKHLAESPEPDKKAQDRKQLAKIGLQEQDARTRREREQILATQELGLATQQLNDELLNYRANLLQLVGDEAGAARLRNEIAERQDKILASRAAKNGTPISAAELAAAKQARDQQAALNEVKQQTSLINQRLQLEEERIAFLQSSGAIGEIEALTREGAARAQVLAKLEDQLRIVERLSQERPNDLQLKVDVEGFRLQVDKLRASLDPLKEKFDGIFRDAGGNLFSDLMNGTKARDAFRNFANSLSRQINDIVGKELASQVFGQGSGVGGFFADLFGGKNRPKASPIDTSDVDAGLTALRASGIDPTTEALIRLQVAADGAAGSVGGSPGTTGDFARLDRGQAPSGERAVMDMFRDASKSSDTLEASNTKAATAALQLASAAARGGSALSGLPAIIQSIIAAASSSSAGASLGNLFGLFGSAFSPGSVAGSGFGSGLAFGNQDLGLYFSTGGYTGSVDPRKPAGIVHGEEYVFSAPAVRAIGLDRLDRLHQRAKAGRMDEEVPGYADGGYVSTSPWQRGAQYLMPPQQGSRAGDTYVTHHNSIVVQGAPGMSRATLQQQGVEIGRGIDIATRRNGKRSR